MKHRRVIRWLLIYGVFVTAAMFYLPTKINAQVSTVMNVKTTHDMGLFYWLIAIIGGIITITLTYVGYRKYKGEEKKRKEKDSNN